MSERMKDSGAIQKPRVFKLASDGMWWADIRIGDTYHCDAFHTHSEAIAKAHEYARMSKEATK